MGMRVQTIATGWPEVLLVGNPVADASGAFVARAWSDNSPAITQTGAWISRCSKLQKLRVQEIRCSMLSRRRKAVTPRRFEVSPSSVR